MPTSINNDTVVVLGASTNTTRYSYKAVLWLRDAGFKVIAVGKNKGNIGDVEILQKLPENIQKLYAISIYLNPHNQGEYYNWILSMNPSQIIFNPLAENEELEMLLNKKGINCIEACTLVMLRTGEF
jgi:predicted CoA-binding protein